MSGPLPVADRPPPYAGVAFDCDSTLSAIEGIEEVARIAGAPLSELEELTRRAMDGEVELEAVFGLRLELVRPTRAQVEEVGRRYVEEALPGARALLARLRAAGKRTWIVSGGLLPAVRALARHLGVPDADVHAVDLVFDGRGRYVDFDRASPLARSGGKTAVLGRLGREAGGAVALVGDGATDLEAAPAAARFVAFGGVVRRAGVFERARVVSTDRDLSLLAPLLLAPDELDRPPAGGPDPPNGVPA